ncbi:MAG: hypothetical protein U1F11_11360 [Steroidobacteraceae bacterium]
MTAWEKFRAAALVMARSGTVKERLQAAYRLHLAELNVDCLPLEVRGEFQAMRTSLTRERPLRGEDALAATIRKLSSHEADRLAAQLIEIFARMSPLDSSEALPSVSPAVSAQVIPLFAEARP